MLSSLLRDNLKSNMDRFIDFKKVKLQFCNQNLKSNMDRFIEFVREFLLIFSKYLKSNMDRFIAFKTYVGFCLIVFKIQYG